MINLLATPKAHALRAWVPLTVLLALALPQSALAAVAKPTTATDPKSCVTAQCHVAVKDFPVVHGPVNVNACDACHKLTDAKNHTFEPTRPAAESCTFCHQVDTHGAKVVHKPLTTGDCAQCHNPHGGFDNTFLRGKNMNDACKSCHGDVTAGKHKVHGPVAAGACGACHAPHASDNPKLLTATGKDLCLSCHKEMDEQMKSVKFVHKALEQDCTTCHDAHASENAMQLKQTSQELCRSCHADFMKATENATHKHEALTKDQACLNCHTPHGGDRAKLVKADPVKICLGCHNQKIKTDAGHVVLAVNEVADPNKIKHGPIREGNCSGCHNVHGGEVSRLLIKPYPETFYESFSEEKYELCFTCHDKQLVALETTNGLTGFRNGDRNLHFVHVNKDKRGRTCRACHETHASPRKVQMRDSVPYGQWELPIAFEATPTGGTCSPGCHKPLGYDRQNPVGNTLPAATTAKDVNP